MHTRELLIVLSVAAVTYGGLTLMQSQSANAVAKVVNAAPGEPTLDIDGMLVVLTPSTTLEAAGDCPSLTITATNPTSHELTVDVMANVYVTGPMSFGRRMGPVPQSKWEQSFPSITLAPGESREFTMKPELKLAAGETYYFTINAPSGDENKSMVSVRNQPQVVPGYEDPLRKAIEEAQKKQAQNVAPENTPS